MHRIIAFISILLFISACGAPTDTTGETVEPEAQPPEVAEEPVPEPEEVAPPVPEEVKVEAPVVPEVIDVAPEVNEPEEEPKVETSEKDKGETEPEVKVVEKKPEKKIPKVGVDLSIIPSNWDAKGIKSGEYCVWDYWEFDGVYDDLLKDDKGYIAKCLKMNCAPMCLGGLANKCEMECSYAGKASIKKFLKVPVDDR